MRDPRLLGIGRLNAVSEIFHNFIDIRYCLLLMLENLDLGSLIARKPWRHIMDCAEEVLDRSGVRDIRYLHFLVAIVGRLP